MGADVEVTARPVSRDLVRCGAELVELSERFYRGIFLGGVIFVGMASAAALALLPLRNSSAGYLTITVVLTAVLLAATPFAVWRAAPLYRLLRRNVPAQLTAVALATALVAYPLRSELWWPSCAVLMLIASLVGLRRALMYCLVVLVSNLVAHGVAHDLDDTPAVSIIGLWIGFVFWCSAFAIFTDRLAAHILRLNSLAPMPPPPTYEAREADADATVGVDTPRGSPRRPAGKNAADVAVAPPEDAGPLTARLTARQLQVVALLADGLRYEEVAACLAITSRQVQRHVMNAIARTGARNANELVAIAVAERLVSRSPTAEWV